MPNRTLKYTMSFRDAKGYIGKMKFFVTGDIALTPADFTSAADTLTTAIEGLTNAVLQSTDSIGFFGTITLSYGTNAQYPAEWMKAVMQFSNGAGQIARFKVPAPKIAIMEADGVTVINDGTSAPVVAFVNAVKNADPSGTFISSESGLPWTHFEGGLVRFGHQPYRINERVKSAHLVAGEGE